MTRSRTRHSSLRSGWPALLVTVAARAVLVVLVSLLGWSLLPAALGWQPTVVMTGSMQPKLVPGDVVVSRPIDASQLAVGQVLLVDSPDHPGELRLHRLVRFGPHGELVTRGDANRSADSTPVARTAVHGVGALHIPYLGLPYLWAGEGRTGPLVLVALALLAVLALAFWWRAAPRPELDDDPPPTGEADEPTAVPITTPTTTPTTACAAPAAPALAAGGLLTRLLVVGATVLVVIAVNASRADATTLYTTTTTTSGTWAANSWFSCTNAVKGDGAASALPLSESSGTTAADISGNSANGTYSAGGITYGVAGPCAPDNRTAVTLDGTAGRIAAGGSPGNTAMTFEIWFKTTGTHGGVLMSLLNGGGQSKVALAMTSSGTLTFANGSAAAKVTTTSSFNDGSWHLAVATVGSSGMALYVDSGPAVTSTATTSVAGNNATGYIGYGKASTLSTGSNDYFQGSIGFASWYAKALTAAQATAHFVAAG